MHNGEMATMECHAVRIGPHGISPFREIIAANIDAAKRERINGFQFQADRDRSLIGAVLSVTVLCRRLRRAKEDLIIDASPYGKPHVRGVRDFEFNIAHSGCWVVCGAGPGRLGVDVEEIGEADAGFAERYFTPYETELLRTSDAASRKRLFYSIWTLKESYIKALGKGLAEPLEGFSLRFQSQGIRAVSEDGDTGFRFRLFPNMDPDYSFAMCGEHPLPETIRLWTLENLMLDFLRLC